MGGDSIRGEIQNVARKQQINDFSGLLFGKITPTDLDGVIEYRNKAYVFFEIKYGGAESFPGQRLCLERLVRDTAKSGKHAVALILEHNIHDTSQSVPAAECAVREIYYKSENGWIPPKHKCNAYEFMKQFFDYVER